MIIGFNHDYYLRFDNKRTILASNPETVQEKGLSDWISRIHPIYSMLFALLSKPQNKEDAESKIADFFGISFENSKKLIDRFLYKKGVIIGKYGDQMSYFPENIIRIYDQQDEPEILFGEKSDTKVYKPSEFIFSEVDLESRRMMKCPHGLVFVVTTVCATQCIYCYADKSLNCNRFLDLREIERVLREARILGIREIQMIGGEFFLHPQWYEILFIARELGFTIPLISTKLPLSAAELIKFKEFNIRLQFSLDSVDPNVLSNILKVNQSYTRQILTSIRMADKLGLKYKVATVLTRETANCKNLSELYHELEGLENLNVWSIRLVFRSLYSPYRFEDIRVQKRQYDNLYNWYNGIKEINNIYIDFPENYRTNYKYAEGGSENFKGARCSANMSHMVILPDGKVTICEQLYWNPRFIIGNIHESSIDKIWNSPKALLLSRWQKKDIQEQSNCSKCSVYETCRDFSNKCYVNTIRAYGNDNWDYPDPRCSQAPPYINDI